MRSLLADAEPVRTVRFADDPEPGAARDGMLPGQWKPDALGLPPGCPVTPLGVDGDVCWYLDPIGQLTAYQKPYGQADTLNLCKGRHFYLYWAWPKFRGSKDATIEVEGWKNEKAREAFIAAATAKGPWSSIEKVRGRGCWPDGIGGIVVHLGNCMIAVNGDGDKRRQRHEPPGEVEGHVYPAKAKIPGPFGWPKSLDDHGGDGSPYAYLSMLFKKWNWDREIDAHLLIGWIGVAFLGAALPWRPAAFITGDKGSGKSTIQDILKLIFGEWLIGSTNTTAAGIYQCLRQDCLPVAVDEFEASSDCRKAVALIELQRQGASGGKGMRGGDRGTGTEFAIKSAFLFSSINAPPMAPQDLSRFALLRLHRLPDGAERPVIDGQALAELGRIILRRMIEEFHRFDQTWRAFKEELAKAGMDGRGQDTFGTLLACADMIGYSGWDDERLSHTHDGDLRPWREIMAVDRMTEFDDATENWRLCLSHVLTVPVDAWRNGKKTTVGAVIEAWFKGNDDDIGSDYVKVRSLLNSAGLTLERKPPTGDWLAIPNNNPATRKLFEGTKWAGDAGAGVWSGALRQGPRDKLWILGQPRINGDKAKCTLISLKALYGAGGIMTDDGTTLTKEPELPIETDDDSGGLEL